VRWFASKVDALTALAMDWKSVIVHLGNIVATERGNITAVAKGHLKKMKDFKFLYMIYFIVDYLCILKSLSLLFQKQDILISTVELHVENAVAALTSFKKVPGLHEEKCRSNTSMDGKYQGIMLHELGAHSEASIESDNNDLVKDGVKYLCERFLNSEDRIEMYTKVYDTFTWPTGMELQNFGVEKVKLLVQHFQVQLASSSMNFENIKVYHSQ
jgi:hypothetical protein